MRVEESAEAYLTYGLEVEWVEKVPEERQAARLLAFRASLLLAIAAKEIYQLCFSSFLYEPESSPRVRLENGESWVWGEGRGYQLERWNLWKARRSDMLIHVIGGDGAWKRNFMTQ